MLKLTWEISPEDPRRSVLVVLEEAVVGHSIPSNVEIRMKIFAQAGSRQETSGNSKARNQDPSGLLNRLWSVTVSRGQTQGCVA